MNSINKHILDKIDIGIIVIDTDQKIIEWNNWLERYTGKLRCETLDKKLTDICPRFSEKIIQDIVLRALYQGQGRFCSSALHKAFISPADEELIEARQNMIIESMYVDDSPYAIMQIIDVTGHYSRISNLKGLLKNMEVKYNNIRESENRNRHLALHDPLTGLPNRLLLMDRLTWVLSDAERNNEKAAVMFFDLDSFKQINDTFGHEAGDILLKAVAARLKECFRKTDTIARIGGDEFVIVLHNIKAVDTAEHIAKKVLDKFSDVFIISGHEIHISVSLGISIYPDDAAEPANLIKNADNAMYVVKKAGKNNYNFYSGNIIPKEVQDGKGCSC